MITISLCIIVKNEEETLETCLNSVNELVEEIIVVDTGSEDRTKEIASRFTDKIFDFLWIDDFSAARNFSFEKATKDYILWLDADDVILPKDAEALMELKETLPAETDMVMMRYNAGFDKYGNVTFSYYRERLARRSCGFKWKEPVHEHLEFWGKVINSKVCITHTKRRKEHSSRNLEIYEAFLEKGETLSIRGMYYFARELKDNGRFAEAALWFGRFLDSGKGWIEDNITACGERAICLRREGEIEEALTSLLRSFHYDSPRAETCCKLGYFFKEQRKYEIAVFWFELALSLDENRENWGFSQSDCHGYIPCVELAVCYDKLGAPKKAADYNSRAAVFKPDSPVVLHNKLYFDKKLSQSTDRD